MPESLPCTCPEWATLTNRHVQPCAKMCMVIGCGNRAEVPTADQRGACWEHRQEAFSINRGMA